MVEFAHLARPLNTYCHQAGMLSQMLLAADRKNASLMARTSEKTVQEMPKG
jgi:hypothetical protein